MNRESTCVSVPLNVELLTNPHLKLQPVVPVLQNATVKLRCLLLWSSKAKTNSTRDGDKDRQANDEPNFYTEVLSKMKKDKQRGISEGKVILQEKLRYCVGANGGHMTVICTDWGALITSKGVSRDMKLCCRPQDSEVSSILQSEDMRDRWEIWWQEPSQQFPVKHNSTVHLKDNNDQRCDNDTADVNVIKLVCIKNSYQSNVSCLSLLGTCPVHIYQGYILLLLTHWQNFNTGSKLLNVENL